MTRCSYSQKFKVDTTKLNILIVEDSKSILKIMHNYFSEKGFNTFKAETLSIAKEIISSEKIDYVILDLNLPDGLGLDLLPFLNTNTKTFILTSTEDSKLRESAYKNGVLDYINKDRDFLNKIIQISNTIIQIEKNRLKTILVVEDSLVIQSQLKDILSIRNYNVLQAFSIAEALNCITNETFDLMLLDVELKDGNGLDFLRAHKNSIIIEKKIPVMLVSGTSDSSIIRDSLKIGAVDVLKKPYVVEELVLKVDLWIDYKRKEDEVACSTQLLTQYKKTVDSSAIVSKTDPKGLITYVNEEFEHISGYTEEELLGKPHNIVRHPDMPKEVFEQMWDTIKNKRQIWTGEVKNKKKDGSEYWVKSVINPIIDFDGNVVEYIAIRTDITEHKKIKEYFESQLHLSTKQFGEALKLTKEYELAMDKSNIICRMDKDGIIKYVNKEFEDITGYKKDEIIGQTHSIIKHKDTPDEVITQLWSTLHDGQIWQGILKYLSKENNIFWLENSIVPIRNDKDEIVEYLSIAHDLTEVFELHSEIEATQREIVYKMGEIGETRSKETGHHVKRVAEYSKLLALEYGLSEEESDILFTASPMHDIGKVGIPDSVLKKPGRLDEEEFKIMQSHADIGYNILKGSSRKVLQAAAIVAYEHHERWDGKGYPRGISGEDIHIYGRITAIADVYDALGSERCYKPAWEEEKILNLFKEEKGKQFDPKLIDIFFANFDKIKEIRDRYKDED